MAKRNHRSKRWSLGDAIVGVIIVALLAWALVPGLGPDLAGLGQRFGWSLPWSVTKALPGSSGGSSAKSSLPDTVAAQQLKALKIRSGDDSLDVPDYDRHQFGQSWADEDRNGCDTRNDILARDLARPVFKPGTRDCVVLSGTLAEPYVGKTIEFKRGQDTSNLVQIDHVVALADAWQSGAWQWDGSKRQAFANDPQNLLAVDGQANQEKSAAAADMWLPSNKDFRCEYVTRQIGVKSRYALSITQSEYDAMAQVLTTCE